MAGAETPIAVEPDINIENVRLLSIQKTRLAMLN